MIANWLDEIETDITTALAQRGNLSARDLGRLLGVSALSAVSYIASLLLIDRVSLPKHARGRRPTADRSALIPAA
jgi:hypothetical protein